MLFRPSELEIKGNKNSVVDFSCKNLKMFGKIISGKKIKFFKNVLSKCVIKRLV